MFLPATESPTSLCNTFVFVFGGADVFHKHTGVARELVEDDAASQRMQKHTFCTPAQAVKTSVPEH